MTTARADEAEGRSGRVRPRTRGKPSVSKYRGHDVDATFMFSPDGWHNRVTRRFLGALGRRGRPRRHRGGSDASVVSMESETIDKAGAVLLYSRIVGLSANRRTTSSGAQFHVQLYSVARALRAGGRNIERGGWTSRELPRGLWRGEFPRLRPAPLRTDVNHPVGDSPGSARRPHRSGRDDHGEEHHACIQPDRQLGR